MPTIVIVSLRSQQIGSGETRRSRPTMSRLCSITLGSVVVNISVPITTATSSREFLVYGLIGRSSVNGRPPAKLSLYSNCLLALFASYLDPNAESRRRPFKVRMVTTRQKQRSQSTFRQFTPSFFSSM